MQKRRTSTRARHTGRSSTSRMPNDGLLSGSVPGIMASERRRGRRMSWATYQKIEALLDDLDRNEQVHLIQAVADRLRAPAPDLKQHSNTLYGSWNELFPKDFDVDAALREIRSEWTNEWDEVGGWTGC